MTEKLIKNAIENNTVFLFTKSYCRFSKAAKTLLEQLKVPFKEMQIDLRDDCTAILEQLEKMTGSHTVPQIFISSKYYGGSSDLNKLYETGKLKQILEESGVPFLSSE